MDSHAGETVRAAWRVVVGPDGGRCRQCLQPIAAGELVAQHTVSGLSYHPACAGIRALDTAGPSAPSPRQSAAAPRG